MTLKRRLVTGIATGALLLNALTPLAFADTTITVSGNGEYSESNVSVNNTQNTTVMQSNDAHISNNVDSSATTGGNRASGNTGGNVSIDTGNANTTTNVSTQANVNSANLSGCATCNSGNTTVNVTGNGEDSENNVDVNLGGGTDVTQSNYASIHNDVDSSAKTGDNTAKSNTGGDVKITTGNAQTNTTVSNMANANIAKLGGDGTGNSVSAIISGNGEESENSIDLTLDRPVNIWQANHAWIDNDVESKAKTGDNKANGNTGGDVTIDTGNAEANTTVENMANFNAADVDCGCVLGGDVTAKISGNGEDSENTIEANLGGGLGLYQGGEEYGNHLKLHNDVESYAKTGYNKAESNTGVSGDPLDIMTGNAMSDTTVSTSANANLFGPMGELELPDLSGLNLDFHFSLGDLLGFLHLG